MKGHDEPHKGLSFQGNEARCALTPSRATKPANSSRLLTRARSPWRLPGVVALLLITLIGTVRAQELVHAIPLDLARASIRPLAPVVQGDPVAEELLGLLRTEQEALAAALPSSETKLATRMAIWSLTADALTAFARRYPESPWTPPLLLHLGIYFQRSGQPSTARDYYEACWAMTRDAQSGPARSLANRALARLGMLLLEVADLQALDSLIAEAGDRRADGGVWLGAWQRMHELRATLQRRPDATGGCGVRALHELCKRLGVPTYQPAVVLAHSQDPVSSLASLAQLASRAGVVLIPAVRADEDPSIPVPSIVHWRRQHFSVIVGRHQGAYRVFEPLNGKTRHLSAEAINRETSGRFLVPQALPAGWRRLTTLEADLSIGRATSSGYWDDKDQACPDGSCECPAGSGAPTRGGHAGPGNGPRGPLGSGGIGDFSGLPTDDGGSLESLCDGCQRPID